MDLSQEILRHAPAGLTFKLDNTDIWRLFDAEKLPQSSHTPTDYTWLGHSGAELESYIALADRRLFVPGGETVIMIDVAISGSAPKLSSVGIWRDKLWGVSSCVPPGTKASLFKRPKNVRDTFYNLWPIQSFRAIMHQDDFAVFKSLAGSKPVGAHLVQLVRKL